MPRPNLTQDARRAKAILDDPVFEKVLTFLREETVEAIEGGSQTGEPTEQEDRENARKLRTLARLRERLDTLSREELAERSNV